MESPSTSFPPTPTSTPRPRTLCSTSPGTRVRVVRPSPGSWRIGRSTMNSWNGWSAATGFDHGRRSERRVHRHGAAHQCAATKPRAERTSNWARPKGRNWPSVAAAPPALTAATTSIPALFVNADNAMRVSREEIFGPVGVVIPFDDDDEAVAIANDSPYGLSGSIWAADPAHALLVGDTVAHRDGAHQRCRRRRRIRTARSAATNRAASGASGARPALTSTSRPRA